MVNQISEIKNQKYKSEIKYDFRKRCQIYSLSVIRFIENLPDSKAYRILSDQIIRSSTSIGANYAEAKAASSKKDFIRYYEIALKSANESIYWLELLRDLTSDKDRINKILEETQEIASIIGASILTMKNKNKI